MLDTVMDDLRAAAAEKQGEIEAMEARLADARSELRRIHKAVSALDPTVGHARRDTPVYADEVRRLLKDGPLTKAEISRKIGGHRTRATYALRTLMASGEVARTGEQRSRSDEYALTD
jgi:hypothetical protein